MRRDSRQLVVHSFVQSRERADGAIAMALGTVMIQETFEESPRLTYRARSRETFGSNLEVFAEEPELAAKNGTVAPPLSSGEGTRDRHSTAGSSPRDISPMSPGVNGECVACSLRTYIVDGLVRIHIHNVHPFHEYTTIVFVCFLLGAVFVSTLCKDLL